MLPRVKRGYRSICFLVAVLMVASGCQKQSSIAVNESAPSAIWHEKTVTFSDPAFGLTLDLPSDWTIRPQVGNSTNLNPTDTFSSPCISRAPDIMPPCTKIQISLESSAVQSFDEIRKLNEESVQLSLSTTILEQREIDLGGLPALWSKSENKSISEYPMIQVLVLVDNGLIVLNAYGELEPVEDILASIRPIE